MTVHQRIQEIIRTYYFIDHRYLEGSRYLLQADMERLSRAPWFKSFLEEYQDVPVSKIMRTPNPIEEKLQVYEGAILTRQGKITGIHYLMQYYLLLYGAWILRDSLNALMANMKLYEGHKGEYNEKENYLLVKTQDYSDFYLELTTTNGPSVVEFIKFFIGLQIPKWGFYKFDIVRLEKTIENAENYFDFSPLENHLLKYTD